MSVKVYHPSVMMTLTFGSKSQPTLLDAKRVANNISRVSGQHLFMEFHYDNQDERAVKYFENKAHFHIPLAREYPNPETREKFQDICALAGFSTRKTDVRVDIKPYMINPNEVKYFLVNHEGYSSKWCACPRKGKCRRKNGCWFRNNMDDWSIARYNWNDNPIGH